MWLNLQPGVQDSCVFRHQSPNQQSTSCDQQAPPMSAASACQSPRSPPGRPQARSPNPNRAISPHNTPANHQNPSKARPATAARWLCMARLPDSTPENWASLLSGLCFGVARDLGINLSISIAIRMQLGGTIHNHTHQEPTES